MNTGHTANYPNGGINTTHLRRLVGTLETSVNMLRQQPPSSAEYEVLRNAVIKSFELTLETAGNMLRKVLKENFITSTQADSLSYKDTLRHAAKHGIVNDAAVARWFQYRDSRNALAHEYGQQFADDTLDILPSFIADANAVVTSLEEKYSHG